MKPQRLDFRIMSSYKCDVPGCKKNIKQDLVNRKMRVPTRCFKHWKKPVGNPNRKSIKDLAGSLPAVNVKMKAVK